MSELSEAPASGGCGKTSFIHLYKDLSGRGMIGTVKRKAAESSWVSVCHSEISWQAFPSANSAVLP